MMSSTLSVVPSETVSSVGKAWIVCRSKSYAGRIYYFNTLTGETVWNLSKPEMQKAKAMTKILKKQTGFQTDNCPEPMHSPEDDVILGPSSTENSKKYHKILPAQIYNKQVINNQFTKPLSNELSNVPNAVQLNIPVTPTFNGLWNLAPQPIFVAPTPVHQLQYFPSFNQVPVTTTTVSLSNRFEHVSNNGLQNNVNFKGRKRKFNPKFNNTGSRKKYFNQKLKNKRNNADLRLIISSRRSSINNIDSIQPTNPSGSSTLGGMRNNNHKNTLRENNFNMLNDDDMWLEENLQSQGMTEKLDATPLKSYFNIAGSQPLHIIADADALLNNVNFLNILLNSDKQCRLIVPQVVMNIIQKATNSRLRTAAHRAAYFISQQIDANLATIVQHNEDNEGGTDEKHCIITCCSNLMKENMHVVILTDSIELNVLKETGQMPILTISEIKKLLSSSQSIERTKSPTKNDSCNIKITIPNEKKTSNITSHEDEVEVESKNEVESENVTNTRPRSSEPDLNTKCTTKNLQKTPSNVKKTDKKRNTKRFSLDSSTKSSTGNSKNSTFASSSESVDEIDGNEETSGNNVGQISTKSVQELKPIEYDNVMFEVMNQAMEDCLRMKSDEWVSRFIQIMEEVLALILQLEPEFVPEALPPPWTVYEATECIKRKFKSDSDIVDAATKLLNVLFELGGLRGKIKNDPSPEKYMEMYSFGVYLIDALQGLLSNSEDLQTAAESLSKLLSDIQNPHLDPSNQDSFADPHLDKEIRAHEDKTQSEIITENIVAEKPEESLNKDPKIGNIPNTNKTDKNSTPDSPRLYNLRSNRKTKTPDKDVIFIRHLDIESSFFSRLELKRNTDKGIFSKILSKDTQKQNQDIDNNDKTSPEKNAEDNVVDKGPTFIRNVSKCLEFEEKLKKNSQAPYDSWTHRNEVYEDYEEELDYGSIEEGYYMDGEYSFNEDLYKSDENPELSKQSDDLENDLPIDTVDFKVIVQKMLIHIKGAYSNVQKFCKNSYEKLSSPEMTLDENDVVLAEKSYLYIENLCTTFNRILEREASDCEYKLQEVFKDKEFEGVVVAEEDLEGYRNFIKNCLVQGNILKESVRLILDASKEVA